VPECYSGYGPGFYRGYACHTLILRSECQAATCLRRFPGFPGVGRCHLPIRKNAIMTEFGTEPSFRTYLYILRRRKWWVASITVIGLAASLAISLTAHKQYSATAQLLVQPTVNASGLSVVQEPVTQTDVQTELQLVTSAPVQQAVRSRLNSTPAVSASEVGQTDVMAITAVSATPSQAALIANLYANAFVQYQQSVASHSLATAEAQVSSQVSSIEKQVKALRGNTTSPEATALLNQEAVLKEQLAQMQVSGSVDTGDVALVTPAQAPVSPSSPKPAQDALLGLVAGLVLGLAVAFLRDSFDDRLTSKEATEHAGGAPVLTMTPAVPSWRRQAPMVVTVTEPASPAAESYRSLRTSLQFARQERQLRALLVTSPGVGEGKTSTLANLGVVFAQAGERVLLVSCDLRRPRIGAFFGLDEQAGLTSVMLDEQTLEEAILPVPGIDRLSLLPAGPVPPNPAELLGSARVRDIFTRLRDQYDLILIDSPPVLPVTDAAILSRNADATLMLAAAGQTRRSDLHRAVEKLGQAGITILGTVLNKTTRQTGQYYGSSYTYEAYGAGAHATTQGGHPNGTSSVKNRSPR
jgi:succinoglycan biosynthesis transport protein ExoP